jgi:hypothetical protein
MNFLIYFCKTFTNSTDIAESFRQLYAGVALHILD